MMYNENEYNSNDQNNEFAIEDKTISGGNFTYIPEEPKPKKKKGGFMRKATAVVMSGILFGGAAGGAFVGVNMMAGNSFDSTKAEVPVTLANTGVISNTSNTPNNSSGTGLHDVSSVVEEVMPSIVAINSTTKQQSYGFFGGSQDYEVAGSGSGIIVGQNDTELLIATNNHVVADSNSLSVTFIDETNVTAVIKGTDSDSDLAVIAIPLSEIPAETLEQIKVATLGDSDSVKVGEAAIAIGNALGYGQSVTVGYISAKDRSIDMENISRVLLQTDAAINPGNSGGALLNIKGEVIGINAAKYSDTNVEGIGYAIPSSFARDILNELMNKTTRIPIETDQAGYLGIRGTNLEQQTIEALGIPDGVYVYQIVEGGPAANSDLKEKDVITSFDGEKVSTFSDIQDLLTYYQGGTAVELKVQRLIDGEYVEQTVEVVLGYKTEAVN